MIDQLGTETFWSGVTSPYLTSLSVVQNSSDKIMYMIQPSCLLDTPAVLHMPFTQLAIVRTKEQCLQ